jgi:hypothetical protein
LTRSSGRCALQQASRATPTPPHPPARGSPIDWGELVQAHDDRDVFQVSPDQLPVIDIHGL